MNWQCPRDSSANAGEVCHVCGQPAYTCLPIFHNGALTIRVASRQRVIGSPDFPPGTAKEGIARYHARVFFDVSDGHWYVSNVCDGAQLWVNGTSLAPGHRTRLNAGDSVRIGTNTTLTVTLEKLGP